MITFSEISPSHHIFLSTRLKLETLLKGFEYSVTLTNTIVVDQI